MGLLRRRMASANGHTTIFFATDVHGSEICFRKFVNAARFYGADLLVLGGDLTGKLVVPIVARPDGGHLAELHGETVTLRDSQLEDFKDKVSNEGLYPAPMSAEEHERLEAHPEEVEKLFVRLMRERLARWIDYAHERLAGTDVRIITTPGNDDPPAVDEVIRERGQQRVLLMEGQVIEVAPGHEMLNSGYSNPTPWHTPREFPEQYICEHVGSMAERLHRPETAIFNIHVPPYDSGIDVAPLLDERLAVRTSMGVQLKGPVGSTAVRKLIERYQPLVSLHGHIHEAGGTARIGRTVAINPGSEYGEGILRGALISVGGGRLHRFQATSG
jgi:Icc-related predicted phosphoesterase